MKTFLDKSQLKHIIIDASFYTSNPNDLLNMDTFEAICEFNDSNSGIIATPNKNGGFDLHIEKTGFIKNEEMKELLKKYKYTVGRVSFENCDFDISELEDIIGFSNENEIALSEITVFTGSRCSIYKDGNFSFGNQLDINMFEKICKLNEKTNGMCHFKINKSGSKDSVTIDKVYLRDASDFDEIQLEDCEVDSDCIVSFPNREFDIKPVEESLDENKSRDNYKFDIFVEIMKKLHELTDDIESDMPDLKKFAIIYDRIGRYISYDNTVLEISETDENFRKCRNLENGLLKGRCVCEGYAEILMNALRMVGIKSDMVTGCVGVRIGELDIGGFQEHKDSKGEIESYEGINKEGKHIVHKKLKDDIWQMAEVINDNVYEFKGGHAWNIVTIDGESFYADVTWDSYAIKSNYVFQHIQSQDEIEQDKKVLLQNFPYKVEGLSKVKKEELVAYQFELAHEREFERKIQIEKKFNNMSLKSCLYMMNTSLHDAKGKFTFTQKMLETLVSNYSLENVIKACHKINDEQLESRINELLEKMLRKQSEEEKAQMPLFEKRPTKLPYSNKRIAEGVSGASKIATQLLIAANSREEDINIEQ